MSIPQERLIQSMGVESNSQVKVQTLKIKAYSEAHAKKVAVTYGANSEDQIIRVTKIKNPRKASTCDSADFPQRGTRKWVTYYEIHTYGQRVPIGLNKFEYTATELVKDRISSKTEAVQLARAYAVKHQLPMMVKIVKKLEKDDDTTFACEPKTTLGEFEVVFLV